MKRRVLWSAAILLFALGTWQLSAAAWVHAKAALAQKLIALSWVQARGERWRAPWPGADTHPIARMFVPAHGIDLFILADAGGRSLAFGPGHVSGTALPGSPGNAVIVAHRDTHFAFLRDLEPGEEIRIETARAPAAHYRVREVAIVDKGETRLLDAADAPQLTLITCYPFDAVRPGTTLRYVVIAERVE